MNLQAYLDQLRRPAGGLWRQLVRYAFSGGLAFAVDFGLLWFITGCLHANYLIGAFFGYAAGLVITYLLSIRWIFNERRFESRTAEFLIFALIGGAGMLLTQGCMYVFTEYVFGERLYLCSKLLTTVIVSLFNFVMKKLLLFTQGRGGRP